MFILVKLIDDCKVRVYVSLYGKLKIEHYTFFINYDLIMIYFVLYMGLLIFVAHFRMSPYIFLHQANTIFWGLLLSPIPFVGRSVFPSVSLLIFVEQLLSSLLLCEAVVLNLHIVIEHIAVFAECRMFVFGVFSDNGICNFLTKNLNFVNFFLITKL